jgi:hypothetical protein
MKCALALLSLLSLGCGSQQGAQAGNGGGGGGNGGTPSTGGPPTLVQHASGSSTLGKTVGTYLLRLPNVTLGGNCVIVAFQNSSGFSGTTTVSDDKGNSYSLARSNDDTKQQVWVYVALNVAAGAQAITIQFNGGTTPSYVTVAASEFYNVATSNVLDVTASKNGTSTSISAGSMTTATAGDLIYQFAVQDGTLSPINSWTQGVSPWALLSGDIFGNSAAQYEIQATAGAVTPTLAMAPSNSWNTIAIALKPAVAGTVPSGMHVVHLQHNDSPSDSPNPVQISFPVTGNLVVGMWIGVPGRNISSLTDTNGNTYKGTGSPLNNNGSGDLQIFYAASATPGTANQITLNTTGAESSGSTLVLFDVAGAASSPFDASAGRQNLTGNQPVNKPGSITGPTITPSTPNGLCLASIGVNGPGGGQITYVNGVSPGNFLSSTNNTETTPWPNDQNNGWADYFNPDKTPIVWTWSNMGAGQDDWASLAACFEAP